MRTDVFPLSMYGGHEKARFSLSEPGLYCLKTYSLMYALYTLYFLN
jgi:hypothetical protein